MSKSTGDKKIQISASSIFFGALIGIGFLSMMGAFAAAIAMSMGNEAELYLEKNIALIAIFSTLVLSLAFFIAGFVSSRISHQIFVFDSLVHSLSTWALMAIFLVSMMGTVMLAKAAEYAYTHFEMPTIVTDIQVFKAKAVSFVEDSKQQDKPTASDKKAQKNLNICLWICFASLLSGLVASILGGFLGRKPLS